MTSATLKYGCDTIGRGMLMNFRPGSQRSFSGSSTAVASIDNRNPRRFISLNYKLQEPQAAMTLKEISDIKLGDKLISRCPKCFSLRALTWGEMKQESALLDPYNEEHCYVCPVCHPNGTNTAPLSDEHRTAMRRDLLLAVRDELCSEAVYGSPDPLRLEAIKMVSDKIEALSKR